MSVASKRIPQRIGKRCIFFMTAAVSAILLMIPSLPVCHAAFRSTLLKCRSSRGRFAGPSHHCPAAHTPAASASFYHTSSSLAAGRRSRENTVPVDPNLSWEKFEFSESPKWDHRFDADADAIIVAETQSSSSKEDALKLLYEQEAVQDAMYADSVKRQNAAWASLDAATVDRAIQIVRPFINDERVERIKAVLRHRTGHTRFLFENPANPSNVWACLRTIEAFGIQHVDVVIQSGTYRGKAALSQKRGMRTAMGSAQWLTLTNYRTTAEAVRAIKEQQNCRIYAADPNPSAVDIRSIDWNHNHASDDRPVCIVMGNEDAGISDEMRALADVTFTLPMVGFAESFNLSVATAITLAHLSAASRLQPNKSDGGGECITQQQGPLRPGDLNEHELNCLMLKGLLNSLPQKRMAQAMLRQAGIVLPKELNVG